MINGSDPNPMACGLRVRMPICGNLCHLWLKIPAAWEALPEMLFETRDPPTL
jgi:hypothetical protein